MRLLVIRTSAMGDVALATPVLRAVRQQYPDIEMVLLTRPAFGPFFSAIDGLNLFFIDLKVRHVGFRGLLRLFSDLSCTGKFDKVIDLHDVLRSRVLRTLFRLSGVPGFVIDKGRSEKREVITGRKKTRARHTVERYADTFAKAGFPLEMTRGPWIVPSQEALSKMAAVTSSVHVLKIGVAPYAMHKLKRWPEEYMIRLLQMIFEKHLAEFYLFGAYEEAEKLNIFQNKVPGSHNMAGKLNLDEELALISSLDLMIAMDSSNMHMAALSGIKVVSVWGGTDPLCGFGAWQQPDEQFISISADELTCRPCTVFGKGECRRGDLACMNWLTPEIVLERMDKLDIWKSAGIVS